MSNFSAAYPKIGYLYQIRYSLYSTLKSKDQNLKVYLESLDDIVTITDTNNLIQTKHHINKQANLSNASEDFWKTIRVWSERITSKEISLDNTKFYLVTTQRHSKNTIAYYLSQKSYRNTTVALEIIEKTAAETTNKALEICIKKFHQLSQIQKERLVENVYILSESSDITDCKKDIEEIFRYSVREKYFSSFYERIEGWWFDKVIEILVSKKCDYIDKNELRNKISNLNEEFHEDSLPIDFLELSTDHDSIQNDKLFIRKIEKIGLRDILIKKAMIDYLKGLNQRGKWIRDELLHLNELLLYEKKLFDEWERFYYNKFDEDELNDMSHKEKKSIGKDIYEHVMNCQKIKIRPKVNEEYIMRGSYHMLADKEKKSVYWYPEPDDITLSEDL